MKTTLLSSLGFSLLAFASIGQMRQTGVPQGSISEVNPNQITYQQNAALLIESSRLPNNTIINRAPCIDTLLFEDFQTQAIPATWSNQDLDGNTDANTRPLDWFISYDEQTTLPGDTNYVATSSSWFTPAGTANNILIMDAVQPCANTIMKWKSAPQEGPAYMDGYEIRVSTTGTNIADFTSTIFTHAEGINGTTTPSAGMTHSSYNGTNGILQEWSLDLGAYDNETIYVAFFHNSTDDNQIKIDDIFIGLYTPFDLEILSAVKNEPYYSTPIAQVTPQTFTTEITLSQDQSVTTPTVSYETFQGATSVFTDAPSLTTMAPGTNELFTSTGYAPLATDLFTTVITASAVEVDPNLSNNIDSIFYVVSDSVFATEDNTFNGALGIGVGSVGFLGNQYSVAVTDDLTSITFVLSTPVIGDTVIGAIYDMTGSTPNALIAMTDTLFVTTDTTAEYTLPIIGGSVSLVPGNYIVGIQESTSANVSLATNTEYFTPLLSWVFFNGNWGNNENYGFSNTYLMRANFGNTCVDPVASYTEVVTVGAVDFTNTSTSTATSTYAWDFGDGQTSTLENPTNTYAANGTYTACLIITDSCGIDTICNAVTVSTIGINENNLIDGLSIYPVPAQDLMTIENLTYGEDFKLELLNNLGQVVKVIRTEGLETIQLDLSAVVDGYYHLRVSNSSMIGTRAVLVKH